MRIEVKIHRVAAGGIAAWRERLTVPPNDASFWRVHYDAMVAEFERSDGLPPEATFETRLIPPRYVWRYSGDTWVHFVLKESRGWLGRVASREVVVIEVSDRPPDL